jgi:pimeloyl-ACP methyl ester carboxylesterase
MIEPAVDDRLELPDGRTLGWAEFGDPDGQPLFFFHGLPGSRWFSGLLDGDARECGIRVVAPERPGFGGSTQSENRKFGDWPDDVERLADHLGLDRFLVAGISGGGAYTLSTAHRLGSRVRAAGVISGGGDISTPEALEGMHPQNRAIFELAAQAGPEGVAQAMQPQLEGMKADPEGFMKAMSEGLPPADVELLGRLESARELLQKDAFAAFEQGTIGPGYEAWLYVQPWDFDVSEIEVPVVLWHGDDDRNAPLSHAKALVDKMPHAELVVWTGMGHLTALERGSEVFTKLLAAAAD